jgi:predicted esterase
MPVQTLPIDSTGRYLHAALALEQFPGQRVSASLHRVVFAPATPAGATARPSEAAFSLYGVEMQGYCGDSTVTLFWRGRAPGPARLFLGVGNFALNRWDWLTPPAAGPFVLPVLGPYLDDHPYLLLAVVVLGNQPAELEGVLIGRRWLVSEVDLSLLCAPVMRFESAALEADWATRNPAASDFEQLGERNDPDGTRRILVAHRVDGLRHYGAVAVPPTEASAKLPVLVLCHPGAGWVGWSSEDWFFALLRDPTLRQQFIRVIPSFRGETLGAGPLGSYTSQGTMSVFDRDADDAIALLNCVLGNFPNADPDRVLSTGWSRGGQVAMRIAQRDQRIRGVIDFAGMTDEWTINGQGYIRDYLAEPRPEPEPWDFYYHTLWEFGQGTCTVWQARAVLLRSCIVYQAARLPKLQIHHGVLDTAVPIHEADRLAAVLATIPGADFEYFRYPLGGHVPGSLEGVGERVEPFLRSFLAPRTRAAQVGGPAALRPAEQAAPARCNGRAP